MTRLTEDNNAPFVTHPFNIDWLKDGSAVPINAETTSALIAEVRRLNRKIVESDSNQELEAMNKNLEKGAETDAAKIRELQHSIKLNVENCRTLRKQAEKWELHANAAQDCQRAIIEVMVRELK